MMSHLDVALTLLSDHADKLNVGEQEAEKFLRRQTPLAQDLLALVRLAQRLKQLLEPIPAPEPFRTRLHDDLLAHSEWKRRWSWRRSRRPLYYSLAAVGSMLPLLGIVVWRRRRRSSSMSINAVDLAAEVAEPDLSGAPF